MSWSERQREDGWKVGRVEGGFEREQKTLVEGTVGSGENEWTRIIWGISARFRAI